MEGADNVFNMSRPAKGSAHSEEDLVMAKVVAMVVLGFLSFFLGVLPVKLATWFHFGDDILSGKKKRTHELVISLLLCFGGGVLLYTTFIHLQPEVREGFEELRKGGRLPNFQDGEVNLAELTFCAGFFLVYIVEELTHLVLDSRAHSTEKDEVVVVHRTMSLRRCSPRVGAEAAACEGSHHHHQMIPRAILAPGLPAKPALDSGSPTQGGGDCVSTRKCITTSTEGLINGHGSPANSHLGSAASFGGADFHSHNHLVSFGSGKDSDSELGVAKVVSKSFRGFLTVLALSFHAVFEGLAVGLESSPSNVWYLFAAVATHKFVIAFCVGVELVSSKTKLSLILVYVATFAVVSPIGIGAGLLLGNKVDAGGDVASVVLQGMAAGTLLYVVFFEILQRERANTQSGVFQLLAIMVGFGVMLALGMTSGHSHSHAEPLGLRGHHEHDHLHDHLLHDHLHDHDHHHHLHEHDESLPST